MSHLLSSRHLLSSCVSSLVKLCVICLQCQRTRRPEHQTSCCTTSRQARVSRDLSRRSKTRGMIQSHVSPVQSIQPTTFQSRAPLAICNHEKTLVKMCFFITVFQSVLSTYVQLVFFFGTVWTPGGEIVPPGGQIVPPWWTDCTSLVDRLPLSWELKVNETNID